LISLQDSKPATNELQFDFSPLSANQNSESEPELQSLFQFWQWHLIRISSNGYNSSANAQFSIAFLINGLQFYRCNLVLTAPFIITGISRETGRLIVHKQNTQLTHIETRTAVQPRPEC